MTEANGVEEIAMKSSVLISAICMGSLIAVAVPANASSFNFSTGDPDGKMATASRTGPGFEIESGDDFALLAQTLIKNATFTGLVPTGASVSNVTVEIYRVFPNDSDVGRTSGAPFFSTTQVPTRVNSPSDVAFDSRSSGTGLSFSTNVLAGSFAALNSLQPGGIHPDPGFHTGGDGPVTGQEVRFSVNFTTPFNLPADHYFFVPQVQLDTGDFLWLSAPRPIVTPGTPFPPGVTDLQAWARDEFLDPDWLRIGTDIVGGTPAPTFNLAFSLEGDPTPLPGALPLFASGLGALGLLGWRRKKKAATLAA
jgi:hypothetical protein